MSCYRQSHEEISDNYKSRDNLLMDDFPLLLSDFFVSYFSTSIIFTSAANVATFLPLSDSKSSVASWNVFDIITLQGEEKSEELLIYLTRSIWSLSWSHE